MGRSFIFTFLLGFVVGALFLYIFSFSSNVEMPFITGSVVSERIAPGDHLSEEDIVVFDDYILIRVTGASISNYAPTGSMRPVFDFGANGIRVVPENVDDLKVGDLVSYRRQDKLIIHRIVEKGTDSEGVYFVTQGDNSDFSDERIRFEDIEYLTIGVLW